MPFNIKVSTAYPGTISAGLRTLAFLGLLLAWPVSLNAQPLADRIESFQVGGNSTFFDVYRCSNEDLLVVGNSFDHLINGRPTSSGGHVLAMRLTPDWEEIWSSVFEIGGNSIAFTVIETDEGDFMIGGGADDLRRFISLRISGDGELIWSRDYGRGQCRGIIELKEGGFILGGVYFPEDVRELDDARVIRIDAAGEVIWDRRYDGENIRYIIAMREGDGDIFTAGWRIAGTAYPYFLRIDGGNGDLVWERMISDNGYGIMYGLESDGVGGFVAVGGNNGSIRMVGFTADGEISWDRIIDDGGRTMNANGIVRMSEGGFVIVGAEYVDLGRSRPFALRTNNEGDFRWMRTIPLEDLGYVMAYNYSNSVVRLVDDIVVTAGLAMMNDSTYAGTLIRLEPAPLGPRLVDWSPRSLDLTVLAGDTVDFGVSVDGVLPNDYEWFVEDEFMGNDTGVTVVFDLPVRDVAVTCHASDEDEEWTLEWLVHVREIMIASYSPDTLNLTIPRGITTDFSIDSIRFNEGNRPQYIWSLTDRSNGRVEEVGSDSIVSFEFLRSGQYSLEGRIYRRESSDAVVWNVETIGAIRWFTPGQTHVAVPYDSLLHFEIVLTNPANESNFIQWYADGELLVDDTTAVDLRFFEPQIGRRLDISVVVSDSVETDTLSWIVDIADLSIDDISSSFPISSVLLSVSPNPFNSTVRISFASINRRKQTLTIHDISGREVANFDGKWKMEDGTGEVVWDASAFPAGIYFARLESGSEVETVKMVLVR